MRYLSSFFITTFLYVGIVGVFLFANPFENIVKEKKDEKKKISLNYVQIVKPKKEAIVKKVVIEKKKVVKKVLKKVVEKPKPIKKVVKKKVIKPKKRIVKKEVIKKEPVKKIKEVAKKNQPKIAPKTIASKNVISASKRKVNYEKDFLANHLHLIKKEIQKNVKYSKRARKLNIQGKVVVEFCLNKDGSIHSIRTIKGHKLLQKSTLKAIHNASINFPKVKKTVTIRVPIEYRLI